MSELFAKWLWIPDPHGLLNREAVFSGSIDDPSSQDVMGAIAGLNGDSISMIVLSQKRPDPAAGFPFSGRGLVVGGGGSNGLYICEYFENEDSDALRACDPTVQQGTLDIKRGEYVRVPAACCVGKEVALNAAKVFLERGEPTSRIEWRDADDIPF